MTDDTEVMAEPILAADHIDFAYGRLQILFDVSMHLGRGETLALLGTNGAGKSTLLRVLSGLETPAAGTVVLDGDDITGTPAEELVGRGLAFVQGGKGVFPDLTVDENIDLLGLTVRDRPGWVAEKRDEILETTFPRLAERLHTPAGAMSGGEQQQLALAKAVMLDPKVLFIDELSLGLAPIIVEGLLEVVRAIHESGVSLILVEQSLNIAAQLCSRAIFMENGAVRFEGNPRELLERDDLARAVFLGGGGS